MLALAASALCACQSVGAGPAGSLRPGMTRAEVLQSVSEVTLREGCPRPSSEARAEPAYRELLWFGEPGSPQAEVVVVAYGWASEQREWVVEAVQTGPASDLTGAQDSHAPCQLGY